MWGSTARRSRLAAIMLSAAALALVAAGCGSDDDSGGETAGAASSGESVELRFAYFSGENTSFGQLWSWWMDEVTKRSDGRVTFERFWDASLLGAPEMADGLRDGRVDLAQVSTPYYPGTFPLSTVTELPFITSNLPAVAAAFSELEESSDALKQEWTGQGLEPVAWNGTAGSALGLQGPVDSVEDLRGKRIRAVDRGSKVLGYTGANLINIEIPDLYGGMQRDLVEGYYGVPFSFVGPLKLTEVTKSLTDLGLGVPALNVLAMSSEGWNDLPEDLQAIMAEVTEEVPAKSAEFESAAEQVTCDAVEAEGVELSVLPEAEVAKLREAGEERLKAEWVEEISSKGGPAEEFYQQYIDAVKAAESEYEYTPGLQQCMEKLEGGSR